jgi:hypothetical protein
MAEARPDRVSRTFAQKLKLQAPAPEANFKVAKLKCRLKLR